MDLKQFLFNKSKMTICDFSDFNKVLEKSFFNDSTVEYVKFGAQLEVIEQSAFENCKELQVVQIGENGVVSKKSDEADKTAESDEANKSEVVQSCDKSFVFDESNEVYFISDESEDSAKTTSDDATKLIVQNSAFKNCPKLHTVIFSNDKDLIIEKDAFAHCKSLRTIVFPKSKKIELIEEPFIGVTDLVFVSAKNEKLEAFARSHNFRFLEISK